MISLLLVFPTVLLAENYPNQAIADFSSDVSSDVMSGSVVVDKGKVTYDITFNLNNKDKLDALLPGGYNNCTQGGMFYHIHVGSCAADSVQFGSDCNSCLGHYDPLGVCGDASNNTLCEASNPSGCLPEPCIACNAANFDADPYRACQVGDWSGKYGLAQVQNGLMTGAGQSFFEVVPGDILSKKMSVVFHCNNKERAFCRSFADSGIPMKLKTVPSQVNSKQNVPRMIKADFSDTLGKGSVLTLSSDGNARYALKSAINTEKLQPIFSNFSCKDSGKFDVTIWTTKPNAFSAQKSLAGSQCNNALRAEWDINGQCASIFSDRFDDELCFDDKMGDIAVCGSAASGIYNCNWPDQRPIFPRYTCAPGDLSGKFGKYDLRNGFNTDFDDTTSLIPYLTDLIPSSSSNVVTAVAIHCPIKDTASRKIEDVEFLVCSEWYPSQ